MFPFAVDQQCIERRILVIEIIDDPDAASLAFALGCKADLADAAGAPDQIAGLGVLGKNLVFERGGAMPVAVSWPGRSPPPLLPASGVKSITCS